MWTVSLVVKPDRVIPYRQSLILYADYSNIFVCEQGSKYRHPTTPSAKNKKKYQAIYRVDQISLTPEIAESVRA